MGILFLEQRRENIARAHFVFARIVNMGQRALHEPFKGDRLLHHRVPVIRNRFEFVKEKLLQLFPKGGDISAAILDDVFA